MSGLIKNAFRLGLAMNGRNVLQMGSLQACPRRLQSARCLWHAARLEHARQATLFHGNNCGCGCRARFHTKGLSLMNKSNSPEAQLASTQGEKELAEFLVDEIVSEKKLQKTKKIPSELDGFSVKLDGSEVVMMKKTGDEIIEVSFNINHSVDSDTDPDVDPSVDKPEVGEMKSRPGFEVEIKRGGKTLGFTCTMVPLGSSQPAESGYNDLFTINEVLMYEGDWKDNVYSVSGEVLDGTLYDLLMNLLEDKGISNEFIEKITDFSTAYEHSCYINMLEDLQKFAQGK